MEAPISVNPRKRKRRRGPEKLPIVAQLVLDTTEQGNTGFLSEDLYHDLFTPQQAASPAYVAVAPTKSSAWVILPVNKASAAAKQTLRSTLYLSASLPYASSLFSDSKFSAPGLQKPSGSSAAEVQILDVIPTALESIVVSLDVNELETFHKRQEQPVAGADDIWSVSRLEELVRGSLDEGQLVHAGDGLTLRAYPGQKATVEFCTPVNQGLLSARTRIIILSATSHNHTNPGRIRGSATYGSIQEEEDAGAAAAAVEVASSDEDAELSDSPEETVGLSLPMLPGAHAPLATDSETPNRGYSNGAMSPGSVISSWSTTSYAAAPRGKVFQPQSLLAPISHDVLHPVPSMDEDEEDRVFVDTYSLARIGCFSGDWVKIEPVMQSPERADLHELNGYDGVTKHRGDFRVAKVYALPGQRDRRASYAHHKNHDSRHVSSSYAKAPLPKVFLSPILLVNINNPDELRISSLVTQQPRRLPKSPSTRAYAAQPLSPPIAKEVTFSKLSTPLGTERSMISGFPLELKRYFGQKQRVVRNGDLIGIPIDESLGRAVYQASGEDETELEDLLSLSKRGAGDVAKNNVAWFKVGGITPTPPKEVDSDDSDIWGGAVIIKEGVTRAAQSGTEQGRLPPTLQNPWQYYFGMRKLPASASALDLHEANSRFISPVRRRLRELLSVATSPQAVHLQLPPLAILLISTQRHIGKATAATNACADVGLHTFVIDSYEIVAEGGVDNQDQKVEAFLSVRADRAMSCGAENTALLVRHVEVLEAQRMVQALKDILRNCRVLVATTTEIDKVPEGVRSLFTHEIEMSAPDEAEREGLLREMVRDSGLPVSSNVDLSSVALKTAALVAGDLVDVVDRALVASQERLDKLVRESNNLSPPEAPKVTIRDIQLAGGDASNSIIKADFDVAVDAARKNFADAIGAPKIPNVGWDDVGGLSNVKDAVMETIQLPLERPELFAKGMKKRSGILFYGPPGTGKTLLAKAIATEFSLNFFSVKGPELLNMYIGESEANVRRVFQRARDARPCVVFFDELDSVAPKRGNQGDSGGVMDRIVSQLLAELDGMSNGDEGSGGGVFVIGATNRPDLLDQALLRPGRFDKMLYLGVSDTHDKQLTILEALTRKFALHPSLSLATVAASLPFTYTGADLYALCSDAMLKAITRSATAVDVKIKALNAARDPTKPPVTTAYFFDHLAGPDDTAVVVEEADFLAARDELVPSVSAKELEHYDGVRRTFEQDGKKKEKAAAPGANGVVGHAVGGKLANGRVEADEDDFVLRTVALSLEEAARDSAYAGANGSAVQRNGKGKGKGKGKASAAFDDHHDEAGVNGFGDATAGDETLYDD